MVDFKVATLTESTNCTTKEIEVYRSLVVFVIGGAGDKRSYMNSGPNGNVLQVIELIRARYKKDVDSGLVIIKYLGYYEVFGEDRIWSTLEDAKLYYTDCEQILLKSSSKIIIIGHSLGGWNGAHLTSMLLNWRKAQKTKKISSHSRGGFDVRMLITLDPVGKGITVSTFSDIYFSEPGIPKSFKNWINLKYDQTGYSIPDFVADLGGQWNIDAGPRINKVVDVDHAYTKKAMLFPLDGDENGDGKSKTSAFEEFCKEVDLFING